ncbi:MAG TPA: FIVAR domain-containing protein, partial [Tissierellaceae bacterium]|nr:FIVAR domain-containing protein [Tissierellaceae bacterium]
DEDDVINLRDLANGTMVKAYKDSARFISYIVVGDDTTPGTVSKTALNTAIANADLLDEDEYTPATWTPFAAALTAAKTVKADANATQAQVDAAKDALIAAQADLERDLEDDEIAGTFEATIYGGVVAIELETGDTSSDATINGVAAISANVESNVLRIFEVRVGDVVKFKLNGVETTVKF